MEFLKKIVWFPAKSQIKRGRNPQVISEMSTVSPGKKEEGYSYGTVYSVVPLDKKRIEELEQDVSKLLQMNVRLTNEIDPKLIGGFKILVEGRIIDASIRKKFDDLESQINLN